MNSEQALAIVNQAVHAQIGRYLNDVEQIIFLGAWQGQTYEQIAETHGYSVKYLKDDSGRKFWRLLTEVFGESVGKNNFRAAIERLGQRQERQETKDDQIRTQKVATSQPRSFREQNIRFCTTVDQVQLAYATTGEGYPLVKAANWLSHLEFDWQSPVWRHWWEGFSQNHKLIRYDERGCGLSDWDVPEFSFDAWVRDLETVIDAVSLDRFALLGISQGGAVAINYAIKHPEKVSHLILYGAFVKGRDIHMLQKPEDAEMFAQLIRLGWGKDNPAFRQLFTSFFIPEGTLEQFRWFNDLQRISSSPENAAKFFNQFLEINVCELATQVQVPTLVLHAQEDASIPFKEGRLLATLIPHAKFVPLNSKNHILLEAEPAWQRFLYEVQAFIKTSS
jgi:pimeloyl-ACP methyl ester carboxylesterase